MGLSRNKVAVSEGAAGSPPFYGERVIDLKVRLRKRLNDLTEIEKGKRNLTAERVLFNIQCASIEKSVL